MKAVLASVGIAALLLAGCAGPVPFRSGNLNPAGDASCANRYAAYDERRNDDKPLSGEEAAQPCWRRSVEEHPDYDLLVAEFSDQGWVQGSGESKRPGADYIDDFMKKLDALHHHWRAKGKGLSLVAYVHGWHHDARPDDGDVVDFRRFLLDMHQIEDALSTRTGSQRRVVGIYVGWRGESLRLPGFNVLTFWDRKNTAERVALGTPRELLEKLDHLRDASRHNGKRDVRMLTIAHSFGGLVTFAAMGPQFLRAAVRLKEVRPGREVEAFLSRVGDLVVIVNPAFEGARYEALHSAGQRMREIERSQFPALVIATSREDDATGVWFPLARQLSTLLERTSGDEDDAIVKAVGHNRRYITHELSLCGKGDHACREACRSVSVENSQAKVGTLGYATTYLEYGHMKPFVERGFDQRSHLCGDLDLRATDQWSPRGNPFWVVRTTGDIIKDHGDVFNPKFVSFFRQLYVGFVYARWLAENPPPK